MNAEYRQVRILPSRLSISPAAKRDHFGAVIWRRLRATHECVEGSLTPLNDPAVNLWKRSALPKPRGPCCGKRADEPLAFTLTHCARVEREVCSSSTSKIGRTGGRAEGFAGLVGPSRGP